MEATPVKLDGSLIHNNTKNTVKEMYEQNQLTIQVLQSNLKASQTIINKFTTVHTLEEYHEDYGDVLWWKFPIEEPPYVGSPLSCDWTGYHTHWTDIYEPDNPNTGGDVNNGEDKV